MSDGRAVAVFGGTFNPIHFGHLRSALELCDALDLAELRFMPARLPPHRALPLVSAEDRANMVELAIREEPRFVCDRRELQRSGPSYTYDTLQSLREDVGVRVSLYLMVGCDAVLRLLDWYRWDELLSLAHLVVLARPGWTLPADGTLAKYLSARLRSPQDMVSQASGGVVLQTLRALDISATDVRGLLQSGHSPRYLLPDSVLDYIQERDLYNSLHG